MGIGDPYHKHPLRRVSSPLIAGRVVTCFHCELLITDSIYYGCEDCDYYIHDWCNDLPITLRVPLHDQHHLTLFEPPNSFSSSSNSPNFLCNECQNPCLGRYAYQCTTCQLFFHLKCLFTLKLEKHHHLLIFHEVSLLEDCRICGSDFYGFTFGCRSCKFFIHPECILIPLEIKRHHVHKLTLKHNFPEECDQVYCDLCEDSNGEMDRDQSYYYCKDCDYIAHVNCCITQPEEVVLLRERFKDELPFRGSLNKKPLLYCTQCSCTLDDDMFEYHQFHTLAVVDQERYHIKSELSKFIHPLWRYDLMFDSVNSLFRCDACGKLGKGSRLRCSDRGLDLHLECFALPGTLEHKSHPNHPLYLRWLEKSTSRNCSVCTKEMDPQPWFYFCQECDYAAHMDCVARDLLLTLRSSIKNQPDFCATFEPDESSFKYQNADMRPSQDPLPSFSGSIPMLEVVGDDDDDDDDDDYGDGKFAEEYKCDLATNLGIETAGYVLACPNCNSVITTQAAHSNLKDWKSSFLENGIATALSESEPLNFLDEQIIDELCCSICNMLVFPPTYSCASCQILFHRSCAELPRKILFNDTTYILVAPPFPDGLPDCICCRNPISNFAYLSTAGGFIFDVQCASGAPLVNPTFHNHAFSFSREKITRPCHACGEIFEEQDTFKMKCRRCGFYLHPECGLLPHVIKHRIHWHPLELATDLYKLYDEYVCDVCEKDLNPYLWAYRCVDECGIRATSHVTCVITSKKKCHFKYDNECKNMDEEQKRRFRREAKKARGEEVSDSDSTCPPLELLESEEMPFRVE